MGLVLAKVSPLADETVIVHVGVVSIRFAGAVVQFLSDFQTALRRFRPDQIHRLPLT